MNAVQKREALALVRKARTSLQLVSSQTLEIVQRLPRDYEAVEAHNAVVAAHGQLRTIEERLRDD